MSDEGGTSQRGLGTRLGRISHPRLVATTAVGVVLVGLGALFYSTAPVLGFRVGFLGAIVALFGASGYVALLVHDFGERNRGRP